MGGKQSRGFSSKELNEGSGRQRSKSSSRDGQPSLSSAARGSANTPRFTLATTPSAWPCGRLSRPPLNCGSSGKCRS
ncbi:Transformation/transcription domain-associated protein [Dissostichus eleginoides]|uniref:Transformation/transcription domain-associated protein n=1 Tax=Dissostichus eleginoides TaxID=100907 RepID=A0AAD9EYD8_DISEL|nr:Transformation/transcription domain-associated protein [Dissostichus eleginoides]